MNYDWSWSVFLQTSTDGLHSYLENFVSGTGYTLALAFCSILLSLILGSALAAMRLSGARLLSGIAAAYVELTRNIPLIVQMFLIFFVLPELLPAPIGTAIKRMPQPWNAFVPALTSLAIYGAGRFSEVLRAGAQSLPTGQVQAALAIGLTGRQAFRHVVLPQAVRIVLPALTSEFVSAVKYSSVAYTIGLLEITSRAKSMQEYTFHVFEAFSTAALLYLVINWTIIFTMRAVEARLRLPGMIGALDEGMR